MSTFYLYSVKHLTIPHVFEDFRKLPEDIKQKKLRLWKYLDPGTEYDPYDVIK